MAYFPTVAPVLADWLLHEPLLLSLAIEASLKERVEIKLVREQGITRLLVRAFQGHYNKTAERALSGETQWKTLSTEEAEKLLAIMPLHMKLPAKS